MLFPSLRVYVIIPNTDLRIPVLFFLILISSVSTVKPCALLEVTLLRRNLGETLDHVSFIFKYLEDS